MTKAHPLRLTDYIRDIPDFPKPGILFRDVTPLLASPAAFAESIHQLADHVRDRKIDLIAAAEARGFLFAAPLAIELGVGLIPIRKPGKLPHATLSHTYELEYGTDMLQMHADAVPAGARVLVVDDLLATGGTVQACSAMIEKAGGVVAGCAFVIELVSLGGVKKLAGYEVFSLVKYE
ncbi:MAG TPA: adenine phosphoribosyltransferase [Thermoguttaceae bacterium]|nr:adenine phosphoribosyltransferase [Thermoguttaceae bacterium]